MLITTTAQALPQAPSTCIAHIHKRIAYRFVLAVALGMGSTLATGGEDAVGTVKTFKAPAFVVRGAQELPAQVGMPIYAADRLRTGKEGSLGVTLKDDTLISSGPNSILAVESYAFNATNREGNMLVSVFKGTLSMISGLIVKNNPNAARIKTPQATIGIRGTEFIVDVESNE